MGTLHTISPTLAFPRGVPFKVSDLHNGPIRGEWWWRDGVGTIHGPFLSQDAAEDAMNTTEIEPVEDRTKHWWWLDHTGRNHGPYRHYADAKMAVQDYQMKAYMA